MKNFILKHKLLCIVLACVVVVGITCAIVLPIALKHEHTYSEEWSSDENNHWHKATCNHDVKNDESAHTFDDGLVTTEPTETQNGVKTFTCTVCGYKKNVSMNKLDHTHKFDDTWQKDETHHWHKATCEHSDEKKNYEEHNFSNWVVKTPEGIHIDRVEECSCTVCGYTKTRTIEGTATHSYSELWSVDEEKHWKESTCEGHTPALKSEEAAHVYDNDDDTTCNVCNYERTPKTNEITINIKKRTYNFDEQPLGEDEYTVKYGVPTIKYKEFNASDDTYTTEAPTNAGSYIVLIEVVGNALYASVSKTEELIIGKKTLKFTAENIEKEYDGTSKYTYEFTVEDGLIEGDECVFSFDVYLNDAPCINVGTYVGDGGYTSELYLGNGKNNNENYQIQQLALLKDTEGTLIIKPKLIGDFSFVVSESDLTPEGTKIITFEINSKVIKGDKVAVKITFNTQDFDGSPSLDLTTGDVSQGTAYIEFNTSSSYGEDYLNYEFDIENLGVIKRG